MVVAGGCQPQGITAATSQSTESMGRDLVQTEAQWQAEDRAGQRRDDLRHGQPGSEGPLARAEGHVVRSAAV